MLYPATYDIVVLQNATFRMQITATQSGGTPINLSGYTIDSDICGTIDHQEIATFVPSIVSAASGIDPGRYTYDVSATQGGGDRYYWLKGSVLVERTCSRN